MRNVPGFGLESVAEPGFKCTLPEEESQPPSMCAGQSPVYPGRAWLPAGALWLLGSGEVLAGLTPSPADPAGPQPAPLWDSQLLGRGAVCLWCHQNGFHKCHSPPTPHRISFQRRKRIIAPQAAQSHLGRLPQED